MPEPDLLPLAVGARVSASRSVAPSASCVPAAPAVHVEALLAAGERHQLLACGHPRAVEKSRSRGSAE